MYYMTTDDLMDWTHYSAPQQLYNPGADAIDADIIKQNNVAQPEMVSVQVNEEFVDREEFATLQLNEGDEVDFLYFMGGGQETKTNEQALSRKVE